MTAKNKDDEHQVRNVSAEVAEEEPTEIVRRREAKENAVTVDGAEARERVEAEKAEAAKAEKKNG
jgi:hypothetical protein